MKTLTVTKTRGYERINITLPEETIELLDRLAPKGGRSRLVNMAVRRYISERSKQNVEKLMKEGAIKWAGRNREIAEEWFHVDEEAWQKSKHA